MDIEARRNIIFEARDGDINLQSGANMRAEAGQILNLDARKDIKLNAGGSLEVNSETNSRRIPENISDSNPTVLRDQHWVIGQPLSPNPDVISTNMMDQ